MQETKNLYRMVWRGRAGTQLILSCKYEQRLATVRLSHQTLCNA